MSATGRFQGSQRRRAGLETESWEEAGAIRPVLGNTRDPAAEQETRPEENSGIGQDCETFYQTPPHRSSALPGKLTKCHNLVIACLAGRGCSQLLGGREGERPRQRRSRRIGCWLEQV